MYPPEPHVKVAAPGAGSSTTILPFQRERPYRSEPQAPEIQPSVPPSLEVSQGDTVYRPNNTHLLFSIFVMYSLRHVLRTVGYGSISMRAAMGGVPGISVRAATGEGGWRQFPRAQLWMGGGKAISAQAATRQGEAISTEP